ncbi:MAG: universal stress protein [Alphaproteobacteria bacterium]
MAIKNILVPVGDIANDEGAIGTALLLTEYSGGHAECMFITGDVSDVIPAGAMGLFETVQIQMKDEYEQDRSIKQEQARQRFDEMLAERNIEYRENALPAELASASWEVVGGIAPEIVASRGGAYDMVVVGHPVADRTTVGELAAEAALFRTGRPVLISPQATPSSVGEAVVIGWNRSASAARAVSAALPLLEMSRSLTIVSVTTGAKQGPSAREMEKYLSWHEISAEVVEIPPDHRLVGEVLLEEAERVSADLLVMGAYSHSRLRELILGGVTRHALQNAGIPVLMAH